jgi:putative ABC transport system permease protein
VIYYAFRQVARSPGFATAAILTLALGIGANTAVFSVADAVLLRPLPYPNADRLVMVWDQLWKVGERQLPVSAATFDAYRADGRVFEAAAAFKEQDRNLTGAGYAERVSATSATSGLFEILGARTAHGRGFTAEDWQPAHNRVAILGYALFERRFGANPNVLGQTVRLDDAAYTVVGVMARDFNFGLRSGAVDIWTPLPPAEDRGMWQFRMLARMRPGIAIEVAQASVTAAATHVEETMHPYRGPNGEDGGYHAIVVPLREQLLGDFRTGALILLSAVALVLLIACANVANLLLARAAAREKEIAVRRALGASNAALLRQCMTEAGVLAALGGAAGAVVGLWGVALLKALSPTDLPGVAHIGIDGRALLFMFAISAVVCLLFGAAPSLAMTRVNWTLRGSRSRRRTSSVLVAAEVALALMLLIGAGLLLKSFARLRQIDPGFRPDHLLTMQVQLPDPRYPQPRTRIRFFSELQQRLAGLPGVISASTVSRLPIARVGLNTRSGNPFSIDGRPWNPDSLAPQIAHTQTVGLEYFKTMGIPLRAGRDFSEADTLDSPLVAVINETLARRFFLRRDAIGRHLLLGAPEPGARWMTIVGIIGDLRTGALEDQPMPQYYTPQAQEASASMIVVLRTAGDPLQLAREASGVVRLLDPDVPVYQIGTMQQHVSDAVGQPRFQTVLLALFAVAALFLAAVGIYGVVAHAAAQRTKEIGIRMALGADAARVVATVLAGGLRPVAAGILLGFGGAVALARLLSSVLFEVAPRDPAAFAGAGIILTITAAAACFGPARRATLLDPQIALREE